MGHRFVEGKIEGEKEFGGKVFPKTLKPPPEMSTDGVDELAEMVKEEREWLHKTLEAHSAILFKGFGLKSGDEFGRVVEAFGWENMTYSAPAPRPILRHLVGGRVYTSNATPVTQLITFHHEMAWVKEVPSKIFLYCLQPSPEGGETSILPSQVVVDQMEERVPEFVSKISTIGFVHRVSLATEYDSEDADGINEPWKWILDTRDLAEAEKRAKEKFLCREVKFREEGLLELLFGPVCPIRSYGGKRVWFNTILCYAPKDSDSISFTDGTKLPESAVETYKKILEENCVNIKWEKGDFLLLDNLLAQHARLPGKPPRQILVSICK
ncbi:putative TauD/TfdA-like domain-containing protein [Rosa chinensis]|uniref:Putative TauD/TfdA-like domain-containing protein n=1 Tax=Rosa chinensis TaxID=74649 RepID=A0A2P6RR33_ROSCH|nr:clavaminate synthase-like protein At3g21360 [Rosa chinensis]PRQ48896.1 putative TauD/TfdA-like domain-containing protein [Rosa chinensis]